MGIITKEIQGSIKTRKIFGIPFLTKHTRVLAIGERYKYRLFGIPIYQKLSYHTRVPATPQESLPQDMESIHKKLDKMGYLVDMLWLSQLQNESFCGQLGQDAIAYSILRKKKSGFYVDIGANDGVSISNSLVFERLGWQGFCVEANPRTYEKLKQSRSCDTYNLAVFSRNIGTTTFIISESDVSTLDTMAHNLTTEHQGRMAELGKTKSVEVQTATFNEIMQNYPNTTHIDFLTLDVEGGEMEVLWGIDFDTYTFGVMTIEANYSESREEVIAFLYTKGYRVLMQNGHDVMFVKDMNIHFGA